MKYCFVDVETTGLDKVLHNIFQLSAIITDDKLKILDEVALSFRPHDLSRVSVEALEKTKLSLEEISGYELSSKDAYDRFIEFLSQHCDRYNKDDKLYMVAYNAPFDSDFLREFFAKHDDQYFGSWFWTPPLCVMQLAAWTLLQGNLRPKMPNFKLSTLCQVAEIPWDEASSHDAQYDNHATIKLLRAVRKL